MIRSNRLFVRTTEETCRLMEVAAGERAADMAVINAKVVNVYTGELMENSSVCIWNRWIAYVGEHPECIGPGTLVIDAGGKTVIPGLIDGHTHLAWLSTAEAFLEYAMVGGTTTIVTETLEPYPVAGLAGVLDFLASLQDQPVKIFSTAPAMASISSAARGIPLREIEELLEHEEIIGLGESYWQAILQEPELFLPAMRGTLLARKSLEGHSAGASDKKLMAYAATGVSSCHEPITSEEVLARLRLGLHVMVREGSIRRDLKSVAGIKDRGVSLRRLTLVSDGIVPGELIEKGYMEHLVQGAIDCGFEPIDAIRMATLNVAEHFRLDHLIGGIAPSRFADMLIVPDLRTIEPKQVISNGTLIAENGQLLSRPKRHTFSPASFHTIHLRDEFGPSDFAIRSCEGKTHCRVRIIEMVTDLVTREVISDVHSKGGEIFADPARDIAKVAAIDRSHRTGKMFVGLVRGFGLRSGAFASSAAWDTSDIVVVGVDEQEMARAVNRVVRLQGGAVLCDEGETVEELPLPLFGMLSESPLPEIDRRVRAIKSAISRLGVSFPDPLLSLITLTGAAIPFLRICEEGLVNLKDGKTLGFFVEG